MVLAHLFIQQLAVALRRLLFVCVAMMIGCTALPSSSVEKPKNLQYAQSLFSSVSIHRNDYQKRILRCDWLPWYHEGVERTYSCGVPYFPYFFYNGTLMYIKESVLLPTWPVTGGSRYQDDAENWVRQHNHPYQQMFSACWPREEDHANVINMDAWHFQEGIQFPAAKATEKSK